MTKLQAALKDAAFYRDRGLKRIAYKVGSVFKGCIHCGDFEQIGSRKKFSSGFNVYRAYCPMTAGFTYWCTECQSRDEKAWENAHDLGLDAIRGARLTSFKGHQGEAFVDNIAAARKERRDAFVEASGIKTSKAGARELATRRQAKEIRDLVASLSALIADK